MDRIEIFDHVLGRGAFSEVKLAHESDGTPRAVKLIDLRLVAIIFELTG